MKKSNGQNNQQKRTPSTYLVHYEETGNSIPRPHEREIAELLANYFKSDIIFLRRYHSTTPDLYILKTNIRWELKSPQGGGKHTIQSNLRGVEKQSENVILDLTRSKFSDEQGISRTKEFLKKERSRIKRLKIIQKNGNVLDVKG